MLNIEHIVILCGGQSLEHEVSLKSAVNIYNALKDSYTINIIKISKDGEWLLTTADNAFNPNDNSGRTVAFCPGTKAPLITRDNNQLIPCELVFPVLHGTLGEDGSVQALCELLGLPFIGCGPLACALAMHKSLCNSLIRSSAIPCLQHIRLHINDNYNVDELVGDATGPWIIKPVHLGSSVGISTANTKAELATAINFAFAHDNELIIEPLLQGARDIECAVISDGDKIICATPGEVLKPGCEIYDYHAKYTNETAAVPAVKAKLTAEQQAEVCALAIAAFKELGCSGITRVDFLLHDGCFYFNEANPIPGFTDISLYLKCLQADGHDMQWIMQTIIKAASKKYEQLPYNLANRVTA